LLIVSPLSTGQRAGGVPSNTSDVNKATHAKAKAKAKAKAGNLWPQAKAKAKA